jgi:hypothetical protein
MNSPTPVTPNPSVSWLAPEPGFLRLLELDHSLQETLVEHVRTGQLEEAHALLQSSGFDTPAPALVRFEGHWSAVCLHARLRGWDEALAPLLAKDPRVLNPELELQFGQRCFSTRALEEGSASGWAAVQRIRLQRDQSQFDAARACLEHLEQLRAIQGDATLDETQRIQAVRQALFGAPPEDSNVATLAFPESELR